MLIRLTSPEALDRLVEQLESENRLKWPTVTYMNGTTYRDHFIDRLKELMKQDTAFVDLDWKCDAREKKVVLELRYFMLREISTDEEWLETHKNARK